MKTVKTNSKPLGVDRSAPDSRSPLHSAQEKAPAAPARAKRCPVCLKRPGTSEVAVGPINVKVCDVCAASVLTGLKIFNALKNFL
jgi:hypothetical protein